MGTRESRPLNLALNSYPWGNYAPNDEAASRADRLLDQLRTREEHEAAIRKVGAEDWGGWDRVAEPRDA